MLPVHNKIVKMVLTLITYIQNTELFHNSVLQISGVLFGVALYIWFWKKHDKSRSVERVVSLLSEFFKLTIFLCWAAYVQHIELELSEPERLSM